MKTCTGCLLEMPISAFWKDNRGYGDGLGSRCKACKRDYARAYRKSRPDIEHRRYWTNPSGERERHLVRKYGVSLAQYAELFRAQGGACAICRKAQDRALDVDHDHETGVVRGLLCTNCNRMVGHAHDSTERLLAAVAYLRTERPSSLKSQQSLSERS